MSVTRVDELVSVVIPTLNEAAELAGTIAAIRASGGNRRVEVIVVDGGSVDSTRPSRSRGDWRITWS